MTQIFGQHNEHTTVKLPQSLPAVMSDPVDDLNF